MTNNNFIVRTIGEKDVEQFYLLIEKNRHRITEYFPGTTGEVKDIPTTKTFIRKKSDEKAARISYLFVTEDIHAKQLCGAVFLKSFEWNVPRCELGYFVDEHYERMGLASKALAEVCDFCFDTLRLNKLCVRTGIDNAASRKLVERNGFELEGILRNDFRTASGKLVDIAYYGRIRLV